jgi:dihydrofolate reductase
MRKIIASTNMTLNGYCDHNDGVADAALHDHYTNLLNNSDTLLYGRTTYQLMESYWPTLVATPSGVRSMDDFALAIDNIHKIVYSKTLPSVTWKNTTLKHDIITEELLALKQQPGKDILVGSPSLINTLTQLHLIDEYQLFIHPVLSSNPPAVIPSHR